MLGARKPREVISHAFGPVARTLARLGVGPDAMTWVGTILTVSAALGLLIPGYFVVGPLVVAACALIDSIDGLIARLTGTSSSWGAFLDSTLDRIGDAAVFGSLCLHFLVLAEPSGLVEVAIGVLALIALVAGMVTSYAKARAQSLGFTCEGGLMERADRLAVVLLGTWLTGLFGAWWGAWPLLVALIVLVAASAWTVAQRIAIVARQRHSATDAL
ncbi:phosphatidylinositol phosphate synthase [Devriesea agamarum]|uniref:phosphatidylinositol phosphate synthase n=1 Tax=Devriesea agamarum TaxID=472569 RepID=UPI00071D8BF7|nr:CDP-alcohol phosphatidyltransferase family protein [Devriesea agamarum]